MIDYATIQDIPALVKLEESCFSDDRLSAQNFRYLLTKGKCTIWVYREQLKIIAAAVLLMRQHSRSTRLYSFAVNPIYHGKGIAVRLLESIENEITQKNYQTIFLEVRADNLQAIHFYKKQGYEPFGRYQDYYADQMDAIRMKKMLLTLVIKDVYGN